MKTTEKDILLLCKKHYNVEKYKTLEEALDAYYRKEYGVSKKDLPVLTYEFMCYLWMFPCIKAFLTEDKIPLFLQYIFNEKCCYEVGLSNHNGCTEFYDVLFHRIVKWLCLLQVKESGKWIVDLSDYEGDII